jgi:hypothetical protein
MYCIEVVLKFQGVLSDTGMAANQKGEKLTFKKYASSEAAYIWELLSNTHPELYNEKVTEEVLSVELKYSDVAKALKSKGASDFRAILEPGLLEYSSNPSFMFSRLDVRNIVVDEEDAEKWISPFIKEKLLVQARIYDTEYNFWQNAHDPLQYKSSNHSYDGLPMVSNGLPFPLEQKIIDISNNPGRWKLKQGYIESVGSTMWLGEQFWNKTGADRASVLSADWLKTENIDSAIKVKAADIPFDTAEGQSGELQNKLRLLLYQNS